MNIGKRTYITGQCSIAIIFSMAHDGTASLEELTQELPSYKAIQTSQSVPSPPESATNPRSSLESLDEHSPLLSAAHSFQDDDYVFERIHTPAHTLDWQDGQAEETKSTWYLFLLTLSIGG